MKTIKIPICRLRVSHNYYVLNEQPQYIECANKAKEDVRRVWSDIKSNIPFHDFWIQVLRLAKGKVRNGYYFHDDNLEIVMVNTDLIPDYRDFNNIATALINIARKK